jgi:alkanesulfonate monooxygenase SsuD/methylene tetrahydromethanopterin reductase-like flavin-dependent oxidoreductase (luciferase family)
MTNLEPEGFPGLAAGARHVEQLGFDSVSAADFISGTGSPALDCTLALAAAAAATERVQLRTGVLILPLRPAPWVATQVATLQHLSGNRVILGVGSGGFPGAPFWQAVGAAAAGRHRRTDEALSVLPDLISGKPVQLDGVEVTLAPATPVPPILVGGNSDRAIRRAARFGDGWFPSLITPDKLRAGATLLRELAAEQGRPAPTITVWLQAGIGDDEAVTTANDAFRRSLVDSYGLSAEEAEQVPIAGSPAQAAERLAAYVDAGVDHFDLAISGGDWQRQCELVAETRAALN